LKEFFLKRIKKFIIFNNQLKNMTFFQPKIIAVRFKLVEALDDFIINHVNFQDIL
jgi:hypothetical protein